MKMVLILLVARGVGGIERRFATLYKCLNIQDLKNCKILFVTSRAQIELNRNYQISRTNKNVQLIVFGLPYFINPFLRKFELFWRLFDYFNLTIILIWKFSFRNFQAIHFVTRSSLLFRYLLKAKIKVTSLVDSGNPEGIISSKRFRKILKKGFHIDNLSSDLKTKVLSSGLSDNQHQHAAPCSFIDYSRTGIEEKSLSVSFVSRFVELKGIDLLIQALPTIYQKCGELKMNIIGFGPKEAEIKEIVSANNLSDRVNIEFLSDPVDVLKESLIFLSLQDRENYPSQALLEAMACGNAIIATNVGLTRKLVDKSVGILINKDRDELVEAVYHIYRNKATALDMGIRAREKVLKEHTSKRFFDYLKTIYQI